MTRIGFLLVIVSVYLTQVLTLRHNIQTGKASILDGNALTHSERNWMIVTGFDIVTILSGITLLIIGAGWWAFAYVPAALFIGGTIASITGNPLTGNWSSRFAIKLITTVCTFAILLFAWKLIGLHS